MICNRYLKNGEFNNTVEAGFHGYTKQSPLATIAECTVPTSSTYLRAITQGTDRLVNTFSTANKSLAHIIMAG